MLCYSIWNTLLSRSIERMPGKNQQVGQPGSTSNPNPVRGTKDFLFASATPGAAHEILTKTQRQRIEQMYQLAEIFAAIFETLPDGYEDAIAATHEAA